MAYWSGPSRVNSGFDSRRCLSLIILQLRHFIHIAALHPGVYKWVPYRMPDVSCGINWHCGACNLPDRLARILLMEWKIVHGN